MLLAATWNRNATARCLEDQLIHKSCKLTIEIDVAKVSLSRMTVTLGLEFPRHQIVIPL
jgi:hypothetical protein